MERRAFLHGLGATIVAAPWIVRAQQAAKVHRIGFLWDSPAVFPDAIEAFRQGPRDLGYVEGRNLVIEYRWAEGKTAKALRLTIPPSVLARADEVID